jgi:pre-mRNA-splicing factor CDC5/CEF1
MRIVIKGGVWKNSEDEILKAAVMKYGKNQWARVASLLNRKSAKQCKARWYEWLDPSIKKTEWSREEEEKLLHLAKLMPGQWRTIAPIVGRTAGQCMEHYERLLDAAQNESADGSELANDDPRKLKAGEIDPTPETKPARPDPIDMDEDEKEMLSEARARLANTKGKKAKRKAREKMLDESRRLAMLTKRRELKAAGIESKIGTGSKKRKFIDYAREIPFQKAVPVGFYDVGEEIAESKKMHIDPKAAALDLSKMDDKDRLDREARERKQDEKRMKEMFKSNAPEAILKVSGENDPVAFRRRQALDLPSPQITENELEDIVKLGKSANVDVSLGGAFSATSGLVGDYASSADQMIQQRLSSFSSANSVLRTPQVEDVIMQEARNQRTLREMTPLLQSQTAAANGDNSDVMLPDLSSGTGFNGITPRRAVQATPNALLLSQRGTASGLGSVVGGTPMSSVMSTPGGRYSNSNASLAGSMSTPNLRDPFGLNKGRYDSEDYQDSDNFSVSEISSVVSSARRTKAQIRAEKESLFKKLQSNLPEPEFSYEVSVPVVEDVDDEEEERGYRGPEDAADIEERQRRRREEQMRQELEKRTTVLKRGLPRPAIVPDSVLSVTFDSVTDGYLKRAKSTINEEMYKVIWNEENRYPNEELAGVKRMKLAHQLQNPEFPEVDRFYDREGVLAAHKLVENELSTSDSYDMKEFNAIWDSLHRDLRYIPDGSDGSFSYARPNSPEELLASYIAEYNAIESKNEKLRRKATKMESKVLILIQGYLMKYSNHHSQLDKMLNEYSSVQNNVDSLERVYEKECQIAERRYLTIRQEAEEMELLEKESQAKYYAIYQYAKQCGLPLHNL